LRLACGLVALGTLFMFGCSDDEANPPAADTSTGGDSTMIYDAAHPGKKDKGITDSLPPIADTGPKPADASGGPTLSTALKHSCFGWPAKEFTTANHAGWSTAVKAGQTAIELNLKDTSGKAYSLSGLLATRPVWMQFGSYT
jgi:hypothetical protein